jgi:hypothetical protein
VSGGDFFHGGPAGTAQREEGHEDDVLLGAVVDDRLVFALGDSLMAARLSSSGVSGSTRCR